MSTFVLIHGGWHAAWCWLRLIPLLEKHGHRVIAPDLPGHGTDSTPVAARPYDLYVPKVCSILNELEDPAILLGHSSGGMIVTEAHRLASERIKGLVYLSAFLLQGGKTPRDVMRMDRESLLAGCLRIDTLRGVSVVGSECAKDVFYGDCSDSDATWAASQLQPEPLIPPAPISADIANPRQVPRFYIECLGDKALSPHAALDVYRVSLRRGLLSSHQPFTLHLSPRQPGPASAGHRAACLFAQTNLDLVT